MALLFRLDAKDFPLGVTVMGGEADDVLVGELSLDRPQSRVEL